MIVKHSIGLQSSPLPPKNGVRACLQYQPLFPPQSETDLERHELAVPYEIDCPVVCNQKEPRFLLALKTSSVDSLGAREQKTGL